MTKSGLTKKPSRQLAEQFAEIATQMGDAMLVWDNARFTRLFKRMVAIEQELKGRTGDQRTELLSLFDHENISVRLQAATACLAIAPQAAKEVLRAIKDSGDMPFAGDAGMRLGNLDSGFFKPT
jgi:hypothetical protein